jgi:hypothetical protein
MKNEMMDSVVYKMMLDLDRMYGEMTNSEKGYAHKAMAALLGLRGEIATPEENEDA